MGILAARGATLAPAVRVFQTPVILCLPSTHMGDGKAITDSPTVLPMHFSCSFRCKLLAVQTCAFPVMRDPISGNIGRWFSSYVIMGAEDIMTFVVSRQYQRAPRAMTHSKVGHQVPGSSPWTGPDSIEHRFTLTG